MDNQDWTVVTLKNPNRAKKEVQERKGASNPEAQRLYKLEQAETAPTKKRLTKESRQDLQAARAAIKKTQRDVDKELAFPPNTLRDFEAGTTVPNNKQLSSLHRYFAASKLSLKTETC